MVYIHMEKIKQAYFTILIIPTSLYYTYTFGFVPIFEGAKISGKSLTRAIIIITENPRSRQFK